MPIGCIEDERLVGADLVPCLIVVHRLGAHRAAILVADDDDVATRLHVTRPPMMRAFLGCQRRRRPSGGLVILDVHVAQLGALRAGVEIRRVGLDPRAQNPFLRDIVRHADQHLIGAIEGGLRRRHYCPVFARRGENQRQQQQASHTAPAFIKSCRCTIPTTFLSPSSTGRAMMPWRSMRLTAALASSSAVVAFGVRVMTSRTGMSRNLSVFSMSRVRSPAVTTPANVLPLASTT